MTNVRKAISVLFLLSIVSFSAAAEEAMQSRQNPLYAVVLQETAGDYEPDYEALGGKIERRWKHRAFVSLPQSAVDVLLLDPQVKFIQRVYTGDPLPDVPLQPRKQSEREIRAEWTAPAWISGNYNYDAAGNIKSIDRQGISGTDGHIDRYAYDHAGRLLYGTVNGPSNYEDYKYDSFGNLVRTRSSARPTMAAPASLSSNRLVDAGYDRAGNLTTPAGTTEKFIYDSFNMLRAKARPNVGGNVELYLYTANDERVAVDTLGITTWMIRDLDGKVLREWHGWGAPDAWVWEQDYIYRGGQLVAAERESVEGGTRHFHLDHLGTPRLITNQLGQKMATHDYFPFGVELTDFRQEMLDRGLPRPEPMKFTGHERDFTGGTSANHLDYIDYMHARYYDPIRGRFLSVDPAWESADLATPQSWNRYSYVRNRPVNATDPDGRVLVFGPKQNAQIVSTVTSVGKSLIHYEALRIAFQSWDRAPANERALSLAIAAVAVVDIGSNLLAPEKGAATTGIKTGGVMLGRFADDFVDAGKAAGMEVLNVSDEVWKASKDFFEEINKPFLDEALKAGKDIYSKTDPSTLVGTFGKEMEYLKQFGEWVKDAATGYWKFVRTNPPPAI